ncbi:hypothetical protein MGG_11657 [Pyricularia oryzae 70-15]|uniref:DUF7729 domain-containing protein n=3 Tax=Pyricularia oryzae TaxID=318829 RepID=G4NE76_PYRO7|nr:uncharacterized protein MGG_11657 [Pyricularia oryzae 70-15]EHA49405.1 hypothetical protein MGG_11657 [Pyricularia oryzae 70-15]ELQ41593.1 hypothetical protein OOU_Y34scaffold00267g30 [Pyricularia oryzae Y34]KAI7920845.1 hypothetical protein M0657_006424 [Pyricularia oryzae]
MYNTQPLGSRRGAPCASNPTARLFHRPRLQWATIFTIGLLGFGCTVAAAAPPPAVPATAEAAPTRFITVPVPTLAVTDELVLDTRQPVMVDGEWILVAGEDEAGELRRRSPQKDAESATTTTSSAPTQATKTVSVSSSPLPKPYDTLSAANFTTGPNGSCAKFYNTMVNHDKFKNCYPFATLLEGSQSFFEAQKSLVGITQTLDAACRANANECAPYLNDVAKSLISTQNCGPDYQLDNSMVVSTYNALTSYQTVYSTTCLIDPKTSSYCFANAVTNATNPNNAYFYYLPLNMTLPSTPTLNCNWCLQQTMAIYQAQSANRKLAVASTYLPAAEIVNKGCGSDFVNATLPIAILQNSVGRLSPSWVLGSVAFAAAIQWLF